MLDPFQAAILGLIQGLTEFLPVSSSGHLIMVPFLLGWAEHPQAFDLALHLGTTIALFGYFWRAWGDLARGFWQGLRSPSARTEDPRWRMALYVVLGSVPAGIAGVVLEKSVETFLRDPALNAVVLILFGLLMWWADRVGTKSRPERNLRPVDVGLIGCAQALALLPGVSRSGITITAGLLRGLDREAATRFSFLLSGPITLAAALYKLRAGVPTDDAVAWSLGVAVSAAAGWAAIGLLLRYVRSHSLRWFVVYRVLFGGSVLWFSLAR